MRAAKLDDLACGQHHADAQPMTDAHGSRHFLRRVRQYLSARRIHIGLVTTSGVRDLAMLRQMEFPVWSRHVHAQGTIKASLGAAKGRAYLMESRQGGECPDIRRPSRTKR